MEPDNPDKRFYSIVRTLQIVKKVIPEIKVQEKHQLKRYQGCKKHFKLSAANFNMQIIYFKMTAVKFHTVGQSAMDSTHEQHPFKQTDCILAIKNLIKYKEKNI